MCAKIVYPDLSYKIMGVLFKVHNSLGSSYKEKHYQRAIESELKKSDFDYIRER